MLSTCTAGIEKALKLVQSFSQVAEVIVASTPKEVAQWATAKDQANIARRFFRLFKWIDCWTTSYNLFQAYTGPKQIARDDKGRTIEQTRREADGDSVRVLLTIAKLSLLGIFLFMEMFCIADAMHITHNSWAPTLQIESLKFWFWSLAASALLGLYELFLLDFGPAATAQTPMSEKTQQVKVTVKADGKKERSTLVETTKTVPQGPSRASRRQAILKGIVADVCDMLIPGDIVGWMPLGPVPVGIAGSISAVLGGSDIWARVNP
ncbi:hypothetical protein, variant [Exophiala xenobiotica]|uniref:Peroxisomal biogenesis factor 11 n=1 Tax=Exophiala xenobiotica TaxID=348802 RepID=A0A0D2EAD1_9EURO|nr:hypothetical protein, variant [Exophiala xenobiotica]KIW52313.1 hypothetical protein, variant [Exophiala xenobiotica]